MLMFCRECDRTRETRCAETLRRWRANFIDHTAALEELGYDEIWTLYPFYCEAGFADRAICDIQPLVTKLRSRLTAADRPGSRGRVGPHDPAVSA